MKTPPKKTPPKKTPEEIMPIRSRPVIAATRSVFDSAPAFWRVFALPPDFVIAWQDLDRFVRVVSAQMFKKCFGFVGGLDHLKIGNHRVAGREQLHGRPRRDNVVMSGFAVGDNELALFRFDCFRAGRNRIDAADK